MILQKNCSSSQHGTRAGCCSHNRLPIARCCSICTIAFEFCPLTVDPTFNLGDFDVTIITYRHLLLQSKGYKNPPVFIGPCCIHYRKTFSTYLFFASTIISLCKQLKGVRAIDTDGEQALSDAFKHEFGLHSI